ncbi:MAG: hypothetical protein JWO56_797 [Acidobacteria bacterium]|nr:hypothetical protein [Acidobacteriota bacterium]
MRVVSFILIFTLLAASLPLGASSKQACCRTKSSCPMKQHHRSDCAIRCGVSAPAPRAVAVRETTVVPEAVPLPLPAITSRTFDEPAMAVPSYPAPPPTPPPL